MAIANAANHGHPDGGGGDVLGIEPCAEEAEVGTEPAPEPTTSRGQIADAAVPPMHGSPHLIFSVTYNMILQ